MADQPDYHLELRGTTDAGGSPPGDAPADEVQPRRRWIGVHFDCCGVYMRVYRHPSAPAYKGYCPRCSRRVTVRVGPDGTAARMFRAF